MDLINNDNLLELRGTEVSRYDRSAGTVLTGRKTRSMPVFSEEREKITGANPNLIYEVLSAEAIRAKEMVRRREGLEQIAKDEARPKNEVNQYFELANENGEITYNGVTFRCDGLTQTLCLGDVSDPEQVMMVPLSGGGSLKVNRDNFKDLSKALGLFTPEDMKRILAAVQTDAKVRSKKMECEEQENQTVENFTK